MIGTRVKKILVPTDFFDDTAVEGVTYCHLCAQPSQDIICETCKVRVQAEAFERKQRIEKEGHAETGRRKMDPDAQWR